VITGGARWDAVHGPGHLEATPGWQRHADGGLHEAIDKNRFKKFLPKELKEQMGGES